MGLTRLAITRPLAMMMFIIGLVILGIVSYQQLRVDRLPNISIGFVSVSVSWSGASPEDIEEFVLKPVEAAVSGVSGVASINSSASSGRGSVSVQLADGVDVNTAAVDIDRKVSALRNRLPADASAPTVNKADPNAFPIMNIALTGNRPIDEILDIAQNTVQPRLQTVLGVADVSLSGGLQREVQIQVDLSKMAAFGITFPQIQSAISRENLNSPAGTLTENNRSINVRAIGDYQKASDLANVVVSSTGGAPNAQVSSGGGIRLGSVANITDNFKPRTRLLRLNGQDAVGFSIIKQSDANSLKVAEDVQRAIDQMKPLIPDDMQIVITNDTSRFTRASLDAVQFDLGLAVLLTALVLLVFLHSWRNVVIVVLAIPTSLISTFIVMLAVGVSLNTITLMALALSIGILVDDSIVVIENIHRHLKLGESPFAAALNGRSEIGLAAMAITMVDVVVYLPIIFMNGQIGRLFREYGITIAIATLFSLFISFTLTPMLASRLLATHRRGHRPGMFERFGMLLDSAWDKFAALYGVLLKGALHVRPLVLLIAVAAFAGALSLVPLRYVNTEYVPTDDDNQLSVNVQLPTGTALDAADKAVGQVEQVLKENVPEVDRTFTSVGGGGFGGGVSGNIAVQLVDRANRSRTVFDIVNDLRDKVKPVQAATRANIQFGIQNPLSGGGGSNISVRLTGDDYTELGKVAQTVDAALREVPGVVDVRTAQTVGDPEIRAVANRAKMADLGISQQTIASTLRTAISGVQVGTLRPDGELSRDITMIAQEGDRVDTSKLATLPVPTAGGSTRLGNVTNIVRATGPSSISRQDRQRVITLSASTNRPLGEVSAAVRDRLAKLDLPTGYQATVGGSAASLDSAIVALGSALGLSILLSYMLMVALYESWLHPFAIMFALPMALIGALVGLWVTNNTLNIFSTIGVIMLMGLVAKNGILLVDYTNTLRSRGRDRLSAILEAGPTRLKPIIMTSTTVVMAMIPLALKLESGSESRAPIAVVVIGGVISSTFLTLFLVPTVYTYLDSIGSFVSGLFRRLAHEEGAATIEMPAAVPAPQAMAATTAAPVSVADARPRRWFRR